MDWIDRLGQVYDKLELWVDKAKQGRRGKIVAAWLIAEAVFIFGAGTVFPYGLSTGRVLLSLIGVACVAMSFGNLLIYLFIYGRD